jgi:hypothetical protein
VIVKVGHKHDIADGSNGLSYLLMGLTGREYGVRKEGSEHRAEVGRKDEVKIYLSCCILTGEGNDSEYNIRT